MEPKIKKDKFLSKMAAKFGTQEKDSDSLRTKRQTVMGNIGDFTSLPEKLFVIGPIGSTRVSKTAPRENAEHGKDGKMMLPDGNNSNTMRKKEGI
jgi:hypothetical protein